jgi:acetyl-CoA C-acetyltransferase
MMTINALSPDDVLIVGVGMTPVAEYWDTSIRELALRAISLARTEAPGVNPGVLYAANMLGSALSGQSQLGALIADFSALRGIEAMTIEAAGASGGAAIRQAYFALKSGAHNAALVVGVEKVTDRVGSQVDAALATSTDADYEAIHGLTTTALAAILMRRYLHEHKAAEAGFSLSSHENAATNPYAMFRRSLSIEQYRNAPMISAPLNMFDAAPLADGAAALMLVRADSLPKEIASPPVKISASTLSVDTLALHDQPDPLNLVAAERSVQLALDASGREIEEIDLFELHDQFSILAALSLEAAGFAPRGKGWELAQNGSIHRSGKIPICTFGGSKARGDAGGATGVYQVGEVVRQIQGLAGENQVPDAKVGMAQCIGGVGSTVSTHILTQVNLN